MPNIGFPGPGLESGGRFRLADTWLSRGVNNRLVTLSGGNSRQVHSALTTPDRSNTVARPVLEVRNLYVESAETAACRDISFAVGPGQVLCVLGGEGAGKSRLMRCIGLDFPPASGSILVQGVDVTGATSERRRQLRARSIELVHPPAPAGVRDLTVPGSRTGLLIQAGPGGTAPVAGMRQRIQIAKALSQGADVLLLDEPFVGVEHG